LSPCDLQLARLSDVMMNFKFTIISKMGVNVSLKQLRLRKREEERTASRRKREVSVMSLLNEAAHANDCGAARSLSK
jgi:hypothetical protein